MSSITQCRTGLGTFIRISLQGNCGEDELLTNSLRAFAEIQRIERLLSFHDPHSELSRVNRNAYRKPVAVSPDMATVLRQALELSRFTDGHFDLTVAPTLVSLGRLPDHGIEADRRASWLDIELDDRVVRFAKPLQVDLGGIAKGYAVDRALACMEPGLVASVNAGGDLRMQPWQEASVAIRIPAGDQPDGLLEVPMQAPAVATSAAYFSEGEHTIVCPQTRKPIGDARSISVFAPSCMLADALTKVVFLTENSARALERLHAVALVVEPDGEHMWVGDS